MMQYFDEWNPENNNQSVVREDDPPQHRCEYLSHKKIPETEVSGNQFANQSVT